MRQIKLEVGNTYRNRKGEEVKIVSKADVNKYVYQGSNGEWYTESGRWEDFGVEDPLDLIEEVTATRHTFTIPEGTKGINVSKEGNRIVVEMVPDAKVPKPGDVMVSEEGGVYIFKSTGSNGYHIHYAWLMGNGELSIEWLCESGRPATPEEAQPLWDALKKTGKRWNPEAMQVEDVPESDRIRAWVWANLESTLYDRGVVAEAIEAYLKHKEGEQ